MNAVAGPSQYETSSGNEQSPSLLTIILDTNPAAWALLSDTLPLSKAIANLLVFINAHLACNYTNKVAVIASHCSRAEWLYPTSSEQTPKHESLSEHTRRLQLSSSSQTTPKAPHISSSDSNKYRPFRLVEEELLRNLERLIKSVSSDNISSQSSTLIAGALTLALSYINRETTAYSESLTGATPNRAEQSATQAAATEGSGNNALANTMQSRILLVNLSPSTDLAHQYIPIMNSIFACQRLSIPVDILQLPLSTDKPQSKSKLSSSSSMMGGVTSDTPVNSTVFLQQAADATKGIFIPAHFTSPKTSSSTFLNYLLTAFLPSPSTRTHLIPPTRIDVDFRAACFCHRNVISIGYVCSICLSIFCSVPDNGDCLTCGTHLSLGHYGAQSATSGSRSQKKTTTTTTTTAAAMMGGTTKKSRRPGGGGGTSGQGGSTPIPV